MNLGVSETENNTIEGDPKNVMSSSSPVHTCLAFLHILDKNTTWVKADSVLVKCSWWRKMGMENISETYHVDQPRA